MDGYRKKSVVEPIIKPDEEKEFLVYEKTPRLTLRIELQALSNLYPYIFRMVSDDAEHLASAIHDPNLTIEELRALKVLAIDQIRRWEVLMGIKILSENFA